MGGLWVWGVVPSWVSLAELARGYILVGVGYVSRGGRYIVVKGMHVDFEGGGRATVLPSSRPRSASDSSRDHPTTLGLPCYPRWDHAQHTAHTCRA